MQIEGANRGGGVVKETLRRPWKSLMPFQTIQSCFGDEKERYTLTYISIREII